MDPYYYLTKSQAYPNITPTLDLDFENPTELFNSESEYFPSLISIDQSEDYPSTHYPAPIGSEPLSYNHPHYFAPPSSSSVNPIQTNNQMTHKKTSAKSNAKTSKPEIKSSTKWTEDAKIKFDELIDQGMRLNEISKKIGVDYALCHRRWQKRKNTKQNSTSPNLTAKTTDLFDSTFSKPSLDSSPPIDSSENPKKRKMPPMPIEIPEAKRPKLETDSFDLVKNLDEEGDLETELSHYCSTSPGSTITDTSSSSTTTPIDLLLTEPTRPLLSSKPEIADLSKLDLPPKEVDLSFSSKIQTSQDTEKTCTDILEKVDLFGKFRLHSTLPLPKLESKSMRVQVFRTDEPYSPATIPPLDTKQANKKENSSRKLWSDDEHAFVLEMYKRSMDFETISMCLNATFGTNRSTNSISGHISHTRRKGHLPSVKKK